ncbi:31 glycoside hydrolase [Neophaeococcomyces mojaviensis]|uniref:31 glycoside hydrolase n=1 Tax=Neophaeococcomyces mojaviensis TaxID=3383035 RepID=A0ACC3A213_9EURO|nr:31 glycoside hydrolase [Knufia sp. JES_112]
MKFTDGMWKVREGIEINWMSNVERTATRDDKVDLLLTKPTRGRGDKLNSSTISTTVRSPHEGITAVNFTHWSGADDGGPHFPLLENRPAVDIREDAGKSLTYTSGPLQLNINTAPNELSFKYSVNDKPLTGHSSRSIAYVASRNTPNYNSQHELYAEKQSYILLELDLSVNEKIYGLGERFGHFIKNGQSIHLSNSDGGTSSEQAYKNVPFYISSRGYGLFLNTPAPITLEIQSERTTRINIISQSESLQYMLIAGPTPRDILRRWTALTGRPPLVPAWSYGLWLTTSFTTSYDEATVTSFLDGFKARSIPLSVFHFDAYWMKSYQWCDFTFDSDTFPSAENYLSTLKKDHGLRLSVWLNSYVGQASPLFAEGKKNGYFIMRADTNVPTVWQWDWWQPGMAIVDFTNPAACTWFASHLRKLMDLGIDSFKTDFGERIPIEPSKVKYHACSDPVRMHNFYTYLYNKCVYETMTNYYAEKGVSDKELPVLFARSATAGTQQFPVHWSGDSESTFEAMAETLRGGLSLSLSGFAYWAHDIGGFEGLPPPALYKRWVQFGLLSSHSRLHGSSSFRVPWIYEDYPELGGKKEAEECSKVLKDMTNLKISLTPYLLTQAVQAHETGISILRPLFVNFGEYDHNVWNIDTQYMLGDDLLVAPVFSEDGEVTFYVPKTKSGPTSKEEKGSVWRSWFDHKKTYVEGQWYTETHDFNTLPLLTRPGAMIPYSPDLEKPEADFTKNLKLLVNGPVESDATIAIVTAQDVGKKAGEVVLDRSGEVSSSPSGWKVDVQKMN